jgi:hypothetical protein
MRSLHHNAHNPRLCQRAFAMSILIIGNISTPRIRRLMILRLNRSGPVTLRIFTATPKTRTATRTAPRESFDHQRIANWTVWDCLKRIRISHGLRCLASLPSRSNDANESVFKFQPEPVQWYSNNQNQNGANDDYRFGFPK